MCVTLYILLLALQEFRLSTAKTLSVLAVADYLLNPQEHAEKGALTQVMQLVGSLGLSKSDLPEAMRSRLEPTTEPEVKPKAAKAKAKAGSRKRNSGAKDQEAEDEGDDDEEQPASKKKKAKNDNKEKASRKRKQS